jgi:hypothetical protein
MTLYCPVYNFLKGYLKGTIFNGSITAFTDIFQNNLRPSLAKYGNPSYFRIFACFDNDGVLSVVKIKNDVPVTIQLNSGNPLKANCLYAFDIVIDYEESINLRYSANATAIELKVLEIAATVV